MINVKESHCDHESYLRENGLLEISDCRKDGDTEVQRTSICKRFSKMEPECHAFFSCSSQPVNFFIDQEVISP